MRAARIHRYGEDLVLEDIPTPSPGPGEVLVKVEGAGFCHSDIHVLDGDIPILPKMPLVLGHENAGRVAALGKGVSGIEVGQPVVVFGGWGCGHCTYCITGHEQLCVAPEWAGLSHRDGGYAEYLLVPRARYLVPLNTVAPADAAPLTDAALTPYRAIKKAQQLLVPDAPVLLIGLGGLGEYGLALLRILTGCAVIVVDLSERKRQLARNMGAAHTLNAADPDVLRHVTELTKGQGVCAAFDFVGSDATLSLALAATRSLGRVSQVGLAGGTAKMKVLQNTRFEVQFEATLWGTLQELHEVVALAESGRLKTIPIERVGLAHINEVFHRLKRGEVEGRAVIVP